MTSFHSPHLWVVLCVLVLALGCQRVHVGDDDGGTGGDSGAREQCGPVTCDPGQVCCNASCGICTGPGAGCITLECIDPCTSNGDCASSEYCALTSCGGTGTCVPRPVGACITLYDPVCGCDGTTYGNACEAGQSGMSIDFDGECSGGGPICIPQDARAVGACTFPLPGVIWNGRRCHFIGSGCDCEGADCGALFSDILECESAMGGCASCAPQDARAEGPCDAVIGNIWNGTECVSESGCSCVGTDCDAVRNEAGACEAAYRHCGPPPPGCSTNAECAEGELCLHPRGECSATGTCGVAPVPPGGLCPDPGPLVCGCDGVTYTCDEEAYLNGVSVAHDGECGGACDADDAAGSGICALFLGYVWDGAMCVGLSGCSCVGRDCGSLVLDMATCEMAHRGCDAMRGGDCGGFAGLICRPDEWCDYAPGEICGATDALGRCRPRPDACTFLIDPVCGCDGVSHDNECFANMAGVDVLSVGSCPVPPGS